MIEAAIIIVVYVNSHLFKETNTKFFYMISIYVYILTNLYSCQKCGLEFRTYEDYKIIISKEPLCPICLKEGKYGDTNKTSS